MVRTGRVVSKEKDRLSVCFERPEMCEKCGQCAHGKHTELISVWGDAEIGDRVDVMMPDVQVVKASIMMYIVPLFGLIAGLWLGMTWIGTDLGTALCGFLGLALCYGILKAIDIRLRRREEWHPRVVAVYGKETEEKEGMS